MPSWAPRQVDASGRPRDLSWLAAQRLIASPGVFVAALRDFSATSTHLPKGSPPSGEPAEVPSWAPRQVDASGRPRDLSWLAAQRLIASPGVFVAALRDFSAVATAGQVPTARGHREI